MRSGLVSGIAGGAAMARARADSTAGGGLATQTMTPLMKQPKAPVAPGWHPQISDAADSLVEGITDAAAR